MKATQVRDIVHGMRRILRELPPTPENIGYAVARATFEVRGNHSEVHLNESELTALAYAAANEQHIVASRNPNQYRHIFNTILPPSVEDNPICGAVLDPEWEGRGKPDCPACETKRAELQARRA
jgi:hypothetical protein